MGTGGSRYGAGRPALHVKAEHCKRIDVRRWQRDGALRAGRAGSWQWTNSETGEKVAEIGYRSDGSSVRLDYSIDGRDCSQRVSLTQSACNYGGTRSWFVCPVRGQRVAVLYLRAGRFACRHCQRIAYASQSGDALDRTWLRQQKIESKLGKHWQRPKGMHQTTYDRLVSAIMECEEWRDAALSRLLAGMMERHPSLRGDPLFS
jgi:hypothetical protein